jgi:hypothetical protein
MHPSLEHDLVHEKARLLQDARNVAHAVETMTFATMQRGKPTGASSSIKSGQKLPYATYAQAEGFIQKFLSLFPNGYLMHIIREPLETINSQVKTFKRNPTKCVENYYSSVLRVYDYIRTLPNSCTIRYENLVADPRKVLAGVYAWMGEEVDIEHIERVITTQQGWECNGRLMPGLRYFSTIVPRERKIILPSDVVREITFRPLIEYMADF